jgi:membrane-bound serine protease (ClpP class)
MRRTPVFLLSSACAFVALCVLPALAGPQEAFAAESSPVPLVASQPVVEVIEVDGVLDRSMADYLRGSLQQAEEDGHTVVIQLATSGSLDASTGHELATLVHDLRVPVLVWVGVPGSLAQGAGAEIAMASSLPTVSPGSGLGPVDPFALLDGSPASEEQLAEVGAWAAERGRVAPGRAQDQVLTAQQALDEGIIPELQPDSPTPGSVIEFLKQADGMTVQTGAGSEVLRTAPSAGPEEGPGVLVRYHELGPWARVLHSVATPTAVWLLLIFAFAGVAFELTQPGFGFAGITGLLALGLAAYGMWAAPPSFLGLALLATGTVLLIVDLVRGRLGWLTALGMAGFVGGSFLLYVGVAPAIAIPAWLILVGSAVAFWYYGFGLTIAQQAYRRIVSTQQGLVGLVGEARNDLNPEGAVHVKGTLWRAKSVGEEIPAGTRVRVRGVDGLVLRVEAEPEED